MKKTFTLKHEKIKTARLIEKIKNEVKKYLIRERKKKLPENYDFWDFDCKFGNTAYESKKILFSEISKHIDEAEKKQLDSFYLEILAKPVKKIKKEKPKEKPKEEKTSETKEE